MKKCKKSSLKKEKSLKQQTVNVTPKITPRSKNLTNIKEMQKQDYV